MGIYKGENEPSRDQLWLYPLGNGEFEGRIYGSKGWVALSNAQTTKAIEDINNSIEDADLDNKFKAIQKAIDSKVDNTVTVNGKTLTGAVVLSGADIKNASGDTLNVALDKKVDKTTKVNGHTLSGDITLTKGDVGLGNVDNTSDANKPISTATQAALNKKVDTTTLNTELAKKANTTDVNAALANKADKAALIDQLSYGVRWNTTQATPVCIRVGNMSLHKTLPIQSSLKGCIVKNGKAVYYLNPVDWTKKADGSGDSKLDGTDGDVMVHHMKFYGKGIIDGDYREVRISTFKIDDTWQEISEGFIGAYRPTTDQTDSANILLRSVVNTAAAYRGGGNRSAYDTYLTSDVFRTDLGKPRTNMSRATFRTYAKNNSAELLNLIRYKWILYWLPVIEYATFYMQNTYNAELTSDGYHQGGLGAGVTNADWNQWGWYNGNYPLVPCGYTNEFGNYSGVKDMVIPETTTDSGTVTKRTMSVCRYRGIEQPFGDVWTNLDGVILAPVTDSKEKLVYVTDNPDDYSDSSYANMTLVGKSGASEGWIKTFDWSNAAGNAEIIPSTVGGGETTYKTDYYWSWSSPDQLNTLFVGGAASYGGLAGLGNFIASYDVSYAYTDTSCRTYIRAKSEAA